MVFAVGLTVAAPAFLAPSFEVRNASVEVVSVVGRWPDGEQRFEGLAPRSAAAFSVSGEGAIQFQVRFPDGRERMAPPIYFTRGTTVVATVTDDAVTVTHAHGH